MPDDLQAIVQRMVEAGEPEDNIKLVIQHYKAPAASAAPTQAPSGDLGRFGGYKMIGDAVIGAAKSALEHPVQSGAVLGSLAAVPLTGGASGLGAIAAAGLGGAGGAGLGSIVNAARGGENGPRTAADVAKAMGSEGAMSAAGEGVGQGVARIAKGGAKLVYKTALRPSMGLQREFGDVAGAGLAEGIPVSERGATKIQRALTSSADTAKQMIADAEAQGASPVTAKEVASEFGDVFRQGRNQAALGRPDPRPAVVQRLMAFDAKNPNGIPLSKAQELKSEAQDLASRAYRAQDLGHPLTDLSAAADKAMAKGLRKGIEARVPGVDAVNARTQDLIGVDRALEDALRRNVPAVGSVRSLLGDFVPSVSSRLAIGADRGAVAAPSLLRGLLAALGYQE